jgi:crotonobetainyl-CoA:carnitine CoA-transferase CaiB-like acyl-CoA transferase
MENENAMQQELERPLDGIRIVEYGLFHAGPGANAILGDLGAQVIKIETASGDPERYWTNVAGFDLSLKNSESIVFEASNRNKQGICLDILKKNIGPPFAKPRVRAGCWTISDLQPNPADPIILLS